MENWKILLIVFTLVAIAVALGLVIGLEDDKNDSNYKKGSTWVAVGYDSGANKQENILWSEDGKEWQVSTGVSFNNRGYGVAYGTSNGTDPLWVAVGYDTGTNDQENILWSDDGKEWQVSTGVSFNVQGYGVASDLLNPALKGKSAAPPF